MIRDLCTRTDEKELGEGEDDGTEGEVEIVDDANMWTAAVRVRCGIRNGGAKRCFCL